MARDLSKEWILSEFIEYLTTVQKEEGDHAVLFMAHEEYDSVRHSGASYIMYNDDGEPYILI